MVNRGGVKIDRAIAELRCADEVRVVGFCAAAARGFIHFAANVSPVGFSVAVAVEDGEHQVNEANVSRLWVDLKTADEMPAGVSIVAFATLPDLDG